MSDISLDLIKKLRVQTGAGMMDVKEALSQSNGDEEKAVDILRKKGLASREKKATRTANQGVITSYIHGQGNIGVLLEVNCETDFVARTDDFQELARDLAMHIAASGPLYVSEEDVPEEVLDKEREIAAEQARNEGKPEDVIEKIVDGRISKFYNEVVLLNQEFIKNPDLTISGLVAEYVGKLGENIQIGRFTRYVLGGE